MSELNYLQLHGGSGIHTVKMLYIYYLDFYEPYFKIQQKVLVYIKNITKIKSKKIILIVMINQSFGKFLKIGSIRYHIIF